MQAVRAVVHSDVLMNIFSLPLDLQHRNVEVVILPAEEQQQVHRTIFKPQEYAGALKLSDTAAAISAMRDEWERC